jgi:hypothetical protein
MSQSRREIFELKLAYCDSGEANSRAMVNIRLALII